MDGPILASNLTKIYTEGQFQVAAVSSVSLQVQEGEVVGLLGPSGGGKTTLLSLLGCILRPTRGSLRIYGQEVAALDEEKLPQIRKRYISFVFQGFNLFPALTAFENVMVVLKMKGIKGKAARRRAEELFGRVGLSERMHFLPRDLSGGQKQRVAVTRALAADSPLILADEPTGNLDYANGKMVMEILKELAREKGKAVIIATHDNRIMELFDRIVFMEDGRIKKESRSES
jgi:putative ABC transport system ATP-binding protein